MADDARPGTDSDGSGQGPDRDSAGPARPGREELRSFLSSAPEGLRGWAGEQLARLDAEGAGGEPDPPAETVPDGTKGSTGLDDLDDEPAADVEDLLPDDLLPDDPEDDPAEDPPSTAKTRPQRGTSARQPSRSGSSRSAPPRGRPSSTPRRRGGVSRTTLVLVVLLSAALVVLVQQTGRGGTSADSTMPADHPSVAGADATEIAQMDEAEPVDAEQEAALQAEAEADPTNTTARQELGVMYLRAALYQDAITWLQQILDTDPDNVDALLTIGVAEYQSNQYEEAETHWRRASQVSPDTAEPWYNLGFLYMAQSPPDTEQAAQCWDKVLEVAPDSDMAETVRSHQGHLGSGSSGSPAPSAPPSATGG